MAGLLSASSPLHRHFLRILAFQRAALETLYFRRAALFIAQQLSLQLPSGVPSLLCDFP
jgi:hypothetical protein